MKRESKQIGEYTYAVQQLGSRAGGRLLIRFSKKLGQGIKSGATTIDRIAGAVESLEESDYDYLVDLLAPQTYVSGGGLAKPVKLVDVFDVHFAGRYLEMGQWLTFCLEVNYGDFLAVLLRPAGESEGSPDQGTSDGQ